MTGRLLVSSTSWCRGRFSPAEKAEIEAALPEGSRITVIAHSHAGGHAFRLIGYQGDHETLRLEMRSDPVEAARVIAARLAVL